MEKTICIVKEMTDFFIPEFYEKFERGEVKPLEKRGLQIYFYIFEKSQKIDLNLEWRENNSVPISENLFVFLELFKEDEKILTQKLQNPELQLQIREIQKNMEQWLEEYAENRFQWAYGIGLIHYMKHVLNSFGGHRDKIVIKAQQHCFLQEQTLQKLWTVSEKHAS